VRRGFCAALVALALGAAPQVARAQAAGDAARADAAFKEGRRLLEKGDLAEACAHFAESKRQAPAVGVTLYLGDCYQRLGKTASAWNEFRSAETMARAQNDKRADLAHLRAHALEPKLETIALHLGPTQSKEGLVVALDGRPVGDPWGAPVPVDPGDHVVLVRLGAVTREFDVHVDAEAPAAAVKVEGVVDANAPGPAPTPVATGPGPAAPASDSPLPPEETAPEGSTEAPSQSGSDPRRLWITLTLAGAGVAGLAVGSAFGLMAISDRNASNAGPCDAANRCSARGLQLRDDAIREGWVSTIGIAAGAVALGASAAVYFAWPHGSPKTALAVSAGPLLGGAGAVVGATF